MPREPAPPFTSSLAHHAADPFRLLIESVSDYAIHMVDPAGVIASWNPAAARMYGYGASAIIGQPFHALYAPEDVTDGLPDQVVQRVLADGSFEFERPRVRHDGTRFLAVVTMSIVRDYFGQHAGFSVVTRDITAAQAAADAVRRERDLSTAVLDSLPGVFYMYDEHGRFLRWNRQFEIVTGYTADEIRQLHPLDLFVGDDRGRVNAAIRAVFEGGESEVEADFMSSTGVLRPYLFKGVRADINGQRCLLGMGIDVTDNRQTRDELRRTRDLLQAVTDSTPDALFLKDRNGRYLMANPAAAQVTGRPVTDLLGLHDAELFDEVDARLLAARDQRVLDTGEIETGEEELSLGGVTRTYQATKAPYRDADGNVFGVLGIYRDVSLRRQAEQELLHSQALVRMASRVGRMGAWAVDLATMQVTWSDDLRHILEMPAGVSPDFEHGINIYVPEDRPAVRAAFAACVEHGTPFDREVRSTTTAGRQIWVRIIGEAIRNVDGVIVGAQGAFQDISEMKEAAEALQLRDRALQAASQGILITDAGTPDNEIIFASVGFEAMTGYTAAEVTGRNCRFLQGPDTDADTVAVVRAALAAGRRCSVEICNYRKDGSPFWNQLVISPVADSAGTLTHFVGVQTDVTERHHLEQQYRQAQKMEAIGRLAGGVAHDFNNLLTVIGGYSDLLLADLAETDPTHELVAEIHAAGERAGMLTRQLLEFSRKQLVKPGVLALNAVVRDADRMLRRLLGEDVILVTQLGATADLVIADPGQLEQVLMNLALNARDAMPRGGRLTIETQNVDLDESYCRAVPELEPGAYVLLAISDTGTGMDGTTQSRIFEPFFTTKPVGEGTGLGLATVHGIVNQSHGHVTAYSEVGLGTTFKVYLPPADGPLAEPTPTTTTAAMPAGTETVLLVEDDAAVRALARRVLVDCGYDVHDAANGVAALDLVERIGQPIHLLVSDVVMPHLGGRVLADRLAELRPDCRVLLLSGYSDDAVIRHGVLAEEFEFLQKPFSPQALARKVRAVLDRGERVQAPRARAPG